MIFGYELISALNLDNPKEFYDALNRAEYALKRKIKNYPWLNYDRDIQREGFVNEDGSNVLRQFFII